MSEMIATRLTLLSQGEGGRSAPLSTGAYGNTYRPHIVIGDIHQREVIMVERDGFPNVLSEDYLGVAFWDGPRTNPLPTGDPMEIVLRLCYEPVSMYDGVVPGATFTLREGTRIVGFGEVMRRWKEGNAEPGAEGDAPSRAP